MRIKFLFIALLVGLSSCVLPRNNIYYRGSVEAKCNVKGYIEVSFCPTPYFLTPIIQPFSRVKITDTYTGKSVILSTRKGNENCIPLKYKKLFGNREIIEAKVEIKRCGKIGVKHCPRFIRGYASWYGADFHGRRTASGKPFDMYGMYAAHRTLPLGTVLEVRNLENGKRVRVKVIDRGPFIRGRNLDLSYGAAKKLGMIKKGVIPYEAKVLRCGE